VKLPLKELLRRLTRYLNLLHNKVHLENWCPLALIPSKIIRKIQLIPFEVFKNPILTWEIIDGQVLKRLSAYVKTSSSHSENRTQNLKGFH